MERPNGNHGWANYSMFSIADEDHKYILNVTGYSGNAGGNCVYSLQLLLVKRVLIIIFVICCRNLQCFIFSIHCM